MSKASRIRIHPPRLEGTVPVAAGRVLGFAEFGDPSGHPCLWFHGTPGARRQVSPAARDAAERLGVRLIGLERPGMGASTPHKYARIADFADDIAVTAERLGLDRFAAVGLSGGGPYTLACAARMPDRMVGAAILGGVVPAVGEEAAPSGMLRNAATFNALLDRVEVPTAWALRPLLLAILPFRHQLNDLFRSYMPPGDQRVFDTPGIREMFMDDIMAGIQTGGLRAFLHDVVLFGREWGFRLKEIEAPVHWWHGDDDSIVPLEDGRHAAALIPTATLHLRPGDCHLSGYAASEEVIAAVAAFFRDG